MRGAGHAVRKLVVAMSLALGLAAPPSAQARAVRAPTAISGLQVRPYIIVWTGDGTGLLGGFTGQGSVKPGQVHRRFSSQQFGRLRWTTWDATEGRAYGAVWVKACVPDCAGGTYHPYGATVHVYRPRSGVFTRMTITPKRPNTQALTHAITFVAVESRGYWYW